MVVDDDEWSQLDDLDAEADPEADAEAQFECDECGVDHSLSEYDSSTVDVSVTTVCTLWVWVWW